MTGPGRDLRALFSTNNRSLGGEEVFADRHQQWEVVAGAVAEHLARVTGAGLDVEDLEAPRTNVLMLHGVGGIGKSTLSRTLEAALADPRARPASWGEPVWPERPRLVPVRIDLARSAGVDYERILLTVRLALAGAVGKPLPAFDLALKRYWEHQHPGESLEEYLRRSNLATRFGRALPAQMQAALGEVAQALLLPGAVGSAIGQLTGALVGALRERRQTVRALAECDRLADLLEAEPDLETLSYYPHLLAWEISQLPADKAVLPVVLLDTFEEIGSRTHRDLERLVQRMVWLMPNVFFVITGRDRLQWADDALEGHLDHVGPAAWPGLAHHTLPSPRTGLPTVPGRQILIGDFSPRDCEDYLTRRLTHDGRPLISHDLRAVIADRSHGLPLYLDLAAARFLDLHRQGHSPTPADFGADFGALVTRTLADLTPDERHLLRSVSLLDAFDLTLATAAAGLTHQAAAARLVERPLVRHNPLGLWPYHLHALIRDAVRTATDTTDDRWTPTDWTAAAHRAHTALGTQWRAHPARDRRLLAAALRQGLLLARDHGLDLDWLVDAAWAYTDDYVWEPLALPEPADHTGRAGTPAEALADLLTALARRQHEHRAITVSRLTDVLAGRLLPPELADMALYYQAKAHRDLGNLTASSRGMRQVAAGGGRLAPDAARGLAHLARATGDFPTAHATAQTLGWPGRGERVLGDIHFAHGDMDRAIRHFTAARDEASTHGNQGEQAIAQTNLALAAALAHPEHADGALALAGQLLTGLDQRATALTLHVAHLAQHAGRPDTDLVDRAAVLRARIDIAGITSAALLLDLVLVLHHTVLGNTDQARQLLDGLVEQTRDGNHAHYVDITHHLAGLTPPTTGTQWIDALPNVRGQWVALVINRRGERPAS
ncbi:ATP/GTP-binding protein (plasmid) [Streptomyces sp. BI20]|uniref:ATP/GTP-binding protein n=1 Tax=Streptomyces sp. BI20 TaxID=3403460 RepID=UPI003C77926D